MILPLVSLKHKKLFYNRAIALFKYVHRVKLSQLCLLKKVHKQKEPADRHRQARSKNEKVLGLSYKRHFVGMTV